MKKWLNNRSIISGQDQVGNVCLNGEWVGSCRYACNLEERFWRKNGGYFFCSLQN